MDTRFTEHATIIADHCLDVEQGDTVVVEAPPVAEPLVRSLVAALGERGASWHVSMISDRIRTAYLDTFDEASVPAFDSTLAAFEAAESVVSIQGAENTAELQALSDDALAAYEEAVRPVQEALFERDWVLTQYPAPGDAQAAEMSTDAYREFVAKAVTVDWDAQYEFQKNLVDVLDPASQVRVRGPKTDVRFSVDGMSASNENGRKNLPGGEVGTAPIPESVDGQVFFTLPIDVKGTIVENARVTFRDGEVTDYSAERGETALNALFETDPGAQRLGEFGIGMNRSITQPTRNMLFDEKMGNTVHFAFGYSLPPTVGANRDGNESAVHQDMLVDMREAGTIEIDDEVIYRDGTFRWEDGFTE